MDTNALSDDRYDLASKSWCVYSRRWVTPWNVAQQSDRPGKSDPGFKITAVWSAVQGRPENAFAPETDEPCTKVRKCAATDFPGTVFGEPAGRRPKTLGVINVAAEMSARVKVGSRDGTRDTARPSSRAVHGPGTTTAVVKVESCDDDYATKPTRCADNHRRVTMSTPWIWLGSRALVAQRANKLPCATATELKSSVASEMSARVKIKSQDTTCGTIPSLTVHGPGTTMAVVKVESCNDNYAIKPTRYADNHWRCTLWTPCVWLGSRALVAQKSEKPLCATAAKSKSSVAAEMSAGVKIELRDNTYDTKPSYAFHGTSTAMVKIEPCDIADVAKPTRCVDNGPSKMSTPGVGLGSRALVVQRSEKPLRNAAAESKSWVADEMSTRVKIEPCNDRDVTKQTCCADNRLGTMSIPDEELGSGALVIQRSEKVVAKPTRCADNESGTTSSPDVRLGSHALVAGRTRKRSHSPPSQLITVPPPPPPSVKPLPIDASWKKVPKPPVVDVKTVAANAISLTCYRAAGGLGQYAAIKCFELYVYAAEPLKAAQPREEASHTWRKMDDLEAADPMATECVLVDCPVDRKHHLAVRAVDEHGRRTPFTFVKIAI